MTIQEARNDLQSKLFPLYDKREAANITDWVLEYISGWTRMDRVINKDHELSPEKITLFEKITGELLLYKPVQYVLHESWFSGRKFYVDESVLIPRPETEELVEWIKSDLRSVDVASKPVILDIGTGSGNIAISLSLELNLRVIAMDISQAALDIAKRNAEALGADLSLVKLDFTLEGEWNDIPKVDIIVSNPPYIPKHEKLQMAKNVLNFEPHQALFVADDDPLIFYRLITKFAENHLLPGGKIYVEISENLGIETEKLFKEKGFSTDLRTDLQGRNRMIRAVR